MPGTARRTTRSRQSTCWFRRLASCMKARWPGSRNVAVVRQGPRRGDDGRPHRRPALVLDGQQVRHRPRGRAGPAGRGQGERAGRRRIWRSRAGRSSTPPSARRRRSAIAIKAAASRSARAACPQGWRCGRVPRLARIRRRHARPRCRSRRRDAARPRRRSRPARDQPVRDRLCRPQIRHRGRGDVPAVDSSSTARSATSSMLLDSRGIDYAVALTADHGGLDIPERLRCGVTDAARVDPGARRRGDGQARSVSKLGLSGPGLLGDGSFGDIWIDRKLSPADRDAAAASGGRGLPRAPAGRSRLHRAARSPHARAERRRPINGR